jgi:hypothetical protein
MLAARGIVRCPHHMVLTSSNLVKLDDFLLAALRYLTLSSLLVLAIIQLYPCRGS